MLWLIELDTSHDCHRSIIFSITRTDKQQPVRMKLLFVFILPSLPGSISETYLYYFFCLCLFSPFLHHNLSLLYVDKLWLVQTLALSTLGLPLALCVVICPRHSKHDIWPSLSCLRPLRDFVLNWWPLFKHCWRAWGKMYFQYGCTFLAKMWSDWLLGAHTPRPLRHGLVYSKLRKKKDYFWINK